MAEIKKGSKFQKGVGIAQGVAGAATSLLQNFGGDEEIDTVGQEQAETAKTLSSKSALSSWISDWTPQSTESMGLAGLSGAVSGAAAGAAAGPWGALAGGVAGLAGGLFGAGDRNRARERANARVVEALEAQNKFLSQKQAGDALLNIAAYGGYVSTHGGDYPTGFQKFKTGDSHEVNPYNGIQQGVDPNGNPNLVEEGETKWDNYVFSDRLKVPKGFGKEFLVGKVDKKTYADASLKLSKESEERPFDPISKRGRDTMLSRLQEAQEVQKYIDKADSAMNDIFELNGLEDVLYAEGGGIHIKPSKRGTFTAAAKKHGKSVQGFASQVLANKENYSPAMVKKANFARTAAKWHALGGNLFARGDEIITKPTSYDPSQSIMNQGLMDRFNSSILSKPNPTNLPKANIPRTMPSAAIEDSTGFSWGEAGLFAPALANVGNLISDITSKPEVASLGRMDLSEYRRRRTLPYEPIDREYMANKFRAQSGAASRNIINSSAGNPASARAALVAQNYNALNALGDMYIKADETNRQRKKESIMFDAEQDRQLAGLASQEQQFNLGQQLREYDINARNRAARRSGIREGINTVAGNIAEGSKYLRNIETLGNMFPLYSVLGQWTNNTRADGGFLFDPEVEKFLKLVKKGGK